MMGWSSRCTHLQGVVTRSEQGTARSGRQAGIETGGAAACRRTHAGMTACSSATSPARRHPPAPKASQVGADADGAPRHQRQGEALPEGAAVGGGDGAAAGEALHAQPVLQPHNICRWVGGCSGWAGDAGVSKWQHGSAARPSQRRRARRCRAAPPHRRLAGPQPACVPPLQPQTTPHTPRHSPVSCQRSSPSSVATLVALRAGWPGGARAQMER